MLNPVCTQFLENVAKFDRAPVRFEWFMHVPCAESENEEVLLPLVPERNLHAACLGVVRHSDLFHCHALAMDLSCLPLVRTFLDSGASAEAAFHRLE